MQHLDENDISLMRKSFTYREFIYVFRKRHHIAERKRKSSRSNAEFVFSGIE